MTKSPDRRKCGALGTDATTALLKEKGAHEAHISSYCDTLVRYGKVAQALHKSDELPWATDGKNCMDRVRLCLSQW